MASAEMTLIGPLPLISAMIRSSPSRNEASNNTPAIVFPVMRDKKLRMGRIRNVRCGWKK